MSVGGSAHFDPVPPTSCVRIMSRSPMSPDMEDRLCQISRLIWEIGSAPVMLANIMYTQQKALSFIKVFVINSAFEFDLVETFFEIKID